MVPHQYDYLKKDPNDDYTNSYANVGEKNFTGFHL